MLRTQHLPRRDSPFPRTGGNLELQLQTISKLGLGQNQFFEADSKSARFFLTSYTVLHTVCVAYYMPNGTDSPAEIFENLRLELRRGCLTLAVLTQLRT